MNNRGGGGGVGKIINPMVECQSITVVSPLVGNTGPVLELYSAHII